MFINSISSGLISNAVWANSSRTLTGLGPTCITSTLLFNQSIAAGATIQVVQPAAGFCIGWLIINAGSGGACVLGIFDGFSNNAGTSNAAGTLTDRVFVNTAGAGILYMQNMDLVNAASYTFTSQQLM